MTMTAYSFNNGNCLPIGITAEGELAIGSTRNNSLVLSNANTELGFVEVVDIALLYSVLIADSLELMKPLENDIGVLCFLSVDLLD